jgi:hypothetical protein
MGSLGLTAAFDVVNVDLQMKQLLILGLPSDWLDLLGAWLRDWAAFVEVSADRSMLFDVNICKNLDVLTIDQKYNRCN